MKLPVLLLAILLIIGIVSAVPTTGAATDVNSNGFNCSATGVTGSEAWVMYGSNSQKENWASSTYTASGGTAAIQVVGAPLLGGQHVYYQACDSTGCGNEVSTTLLAVTPVPTSNFGIYFRNITKSRFYAPVIGESMAQSYSQVMPISVMIGIMAMFFMFGLWMRTRSVRLIAIVGILLCPMILFSYQGLYLGLPALAPALIAGLLAAGMAGILFAFGRK